jgi:hypothetical protein
MLEVTAIYIYDEYPKAQSSIFSTSPHHRRYHGRKGPCGVKVCILYVSKNEGGRKAGK